MPVFICPNCGTRSVDVDGYEGFTSNTPQCRNCGFGFLFQLLDRDDEVVRLGQQMAQVTRQGAHRDPPVAG